LIPMTADPFSIHGTELMQRVLKEHLYDYGVEVKVIGVVFTSLAPNPLSVIENAKVINEITALWDKGDIFVTKISKSKFYRTFKYLTDESGDIDLMSAKSYHAQKQEFREFVEEFLGKMEA
jgi:cellulose biosynthesis protein BcsQ